MEPKQNLPESFFCPLTQEVMKDPVMDPEGNSYERVAITDWLSKNSTSPITRNPLKVEELVPNRALKETMEALLSGQVGNNVANSQASSGSSAKSDLKIEAVSRDGKTLISIIPPASKAGIKRTPSNICCVIDVSGSMASEAKIQNEQGKNEGFGLSILDLVKHAVRTIISSLDSNDRLSLVSFTTEAKVCLNLTNMDAKGKKKAENALECMKPEDSTNIWDGLYKGLEVLRSGAAGKNSSIFLLTDGMPNIVPPRGHLPMLQKYRDEYGLPGIINTFGFGYSLDSKLLHELAVEGNGAYAFIPDGSFVGTIFVNALSNLLSTVATNACLSVELDQKITPDYSLISQYKHQITSWGLEMQLGSVLFGQPKQIVIPFTIDPENKLPITLKYETHFENGPIKFSQEIEVQNKEDPQIEIQSFRLEFVNEVNKALGLRAANSNDCLKVTKDLATKIKSSNVANVKFIKDLLADLEGQATMAVEKNDTFNKWGKHFLPSLIRAHLLQQCNNFKDPGVQNYGGEVFNKIRDIIDDIFVKLPPPKPTVKKAEPYKPVQNMKVFYNAGGGCIDGSCLVQMADGSIKLVQDIVKGDLVSTVNGQSAKVRCVVKTICKDNKAQLVQLESGLRITAWHPVRLQGKFFFPCTIEQPFQYEFYNCPAVYNFVLEDHHLMIVNGVECVTLAHGFQEDVVRHEYYGTQAIIEDLMKIQGWNNGLVLLESGDMRRDEKTGMVTGITKMKSVNNQVVEESLNVSVM